MNSHQRRIIKRIKASIICPNCGEKGPHWVVVPVNAWFGLGHRADGGFWVCSKYYGKDGRRLPD